LNRTFGPNTTFESSILFRKKPLPPPEDIGIRDQDQGRKLTRKTEIQIAIIKIITHLKDMGCLSAWKMIPLLSKKNINIKYLIMPIITPISFRYPPKLGRYRIFREELVLLLTMQALPSEKKYELL
jgi:hypothetical protein